MVISIARHVRLPIVVSGADQALCSKSCRYHVARSGGASCRLFGRLFARKTYEEHVARATIATYYERHKKCLQLEADS